MKTIHIQADESVLGTILEYLKRFPRQKVRIDLEEEPGDEKQFKALNLDTRGFRFNREEANER